MLRDVVSNQNFPTLRSKLNWLNKSRKKHLLDDFIRTSLFWIELNNIIKNTQSEWRGLYTLTTFCSKSNWGKPQGSWSEYFKINLLVEICEVDYTAYNDKVSQEICEQILPYYCPISPGDEPNHYNVAILEGILDQPYKQT